MNNVYLDYASTTPIDKDILQSYIKLLNENYANADSKHYMGNVAKNYLRIAKNRIADLLNVDENEIIFTSGSTEANNLAIKGVCFANANKGKHIITSKVEHPSVLDTFKQLETVFGFNVTYLDVDSEGKVSLPELKKTLRKDTILVSIMAVNNELGSINDIEEICTIVKAISKAYIHVDATQAIGKENIDYSRVDLYNFSSHKIHGLKGCGVLVKRKNVNISPLVVGGQQENGMRGGTSNWPAYTMMAKTLRKALSSQAKNREYVEELNKYLKEKLVNIDKLVINSPNDATPYILNFCVLGKKGEVILNALSNNGICISSKSACSSKSNDYSIPVYEITHNEEIAKNSLRISLSHLTKKEEIDYFIYCLLNILKETI